MNPEFDCYGASSLGITGFAAEVVWQAWEAYEQWVIRVCRQLRRPWFIERQKPKRLNWRRLWVWLGLRQPCWRAGRWKSLT